MNPFLFILFFPYVFLVGNSTTKGIDVTPETTGNIDFASGLINPVLNFRELPRIPKMKNRTSDSQIFETSIEIPEQFQSLKMEKLDSYMIPEKICEIETMNDMASFSAFEDMVQTSKRTADQYFNVASAMIHFEELANGSLIRSFNKNRAHLKLCSYDENLFELKLNVSTCSVIFNT